MLEGLLMKTIQERYEEIKNDQDITDKIDKLIIDCYHYKIFREKASSKYKKSFKDDFEQDYPTYVTDITNKLADSLRARIRFYKDEEKFENIDRRQREKRGYSDTDVWNMNDWFIGTVTPMLKQFRKRHNGIPGSFLKSYTPTPEEREDELLAKDWTDLEESIARRKEWMCRQILFEGKIDVEDEEEGLDVQIDFGFSNITYLGADAKWSLASVDPLKVLREIRRKIIKATGKAPDIAIFASDAIEDFVNNPYVMKAMNVLNMKNVVIEPRVVDPALTFYGNFNPRSRKGSDLVDISRCLN